MFLAASIQLIHAKIRLFTFHYNRPDFIEMQHATLNKFLAEKDDYELIVFNDARDKKLKSEIEATCNRLHITCINFPQNLHHEGKLYHEAIQQGLAKGHPEENGGVRHCQLAQYALDHYGYDHNDIVGILDGDMFLIRPFSIRELCNTNDLVGVVREDRAGKGLEYIWIGLAFFNPIKLPDIKSFSFNLTWVNNIFLDSGGSTHLYMKNHPHLIIQKYKPLLITELSKKTSAELQSQGFYPHEIKFIEQMQFYAAEATYSQAEFNFDGTFLHYSWSRSTGPTSHKSQVFKNFLNTILAN